MNAKSSTEKSVNNSADVSLSKGEQRKRVVVEAIIHSLATHGLNHTTLESIGKVAKMKRSHLVYYFANHDEMIQGAIQHVAKTAQEITRARVEKAVTPEEKLNAIIDSVFEHITKHPEHAAVLTVFYHLCTSQASFRQLHSAIREVGVERLVGVVKDLLKEKHSDRTYRAYAKAIQGILFGYLLEFMTSNSPWPSTEVNIEAKKAVFVLLGLKLTL